MEPESSLPHSQQPATCPCLKYVPILSRTKESVQVRGSV
jgi:hypothetical protein